LKQFLSSRARQIWLDSIQFLPYINTWPSLKKNTWPNWVPEGSADAIEISTRATYIGPTNCLVIRSTIIITIIIIILIKIMWITMHCIYIYQSKLINVIDRRSRILSLLSSSSSSPPLSLAIPYPHLYLHPFNSTQPMDHSWENWPLHSVIKNHSTIINMFHIIFIN
jgi:hypothetical protein